jgi:uncharacterized protein YfbU (UPF0304 family)
MSAAEFIVKELESFEEFKGRDFNSHMPLVNSYRRMLSVYKPMLSTSTLRDTGHFTADQLIAILNEQVHPEHR